LTTFAAGLKHDMKIALIGYGKMGREIELAALERKHSVVSIIDISNQEDFDSRSFLSAEVAIEFSRPESAFGNYQKCFERHIPVVTGTTGLLNRLGEVKRICEGGGHTFFHASNFSIGVNIFFAVNRYLAKIMDNFSEYEVGMKEVHHIHKLDSPSGTGITLAEDIVSNIGRKKQWKEAGEGEVSDLLIRSEREGEVAGIHEVFYESLADIVSIRHEAKNRKGFALGAVLAAEFVKGKKGFFTMNDMLNF
jgi:4-hydroxy-tetrahydrodipicolinate reductase